MKLDEYISNNFDNSISCIDFEANIYSNCALKDEINEKYFMYYKISTSMKKIKTRIFNQF